MRKSSTGLAAYLLLASLLSLGARPLHPYRTAAAIDTLLALGPHAGDCERCHTMHGKSDLVYVHALLGPDENSLCDGCHSTPWQGGSYAGTTLYLSSSHAAGNGTAWPGPPHSPWLGQWGCSRSQTTRR